MWLWRRIEKSKWTDKLTNAEALSLAIETSKLSRFSVMVLIPFRSGSWDDFLSQFSVTVFCHIFLSQFYFSLGLGVGMIAIAFFISLYYSTIIMWSLYYLFSTFQAKLPWVGCKNKWNNEREYNPPPSNDLP